MRRRAAIALLGGAAASWPRRPRAQTMPVVGFLSPSAPEGHARRVAAFQLGLAEAGFAEGRNVAIEFRWAEDRYDRLPALARELVERPVAVLFAANTAVLPVRAMGTAIPLVFMVGFDPVAGGLVAGLSRPGGSATGVTVLSVGLGAKRAELLHEMVPQAATIAVLVNPDNMGTASLVGEIEAAARRLGLQVHVESVRAERDLAPAFAAMAGQRAALLVGGDAFFTNQRDRIVALAARHALPASYAVREFVDAGGLMSYGPSFEDAYRQAGVYVGRVLRGERPGELPVMQPAQFELVINRGAARALGLAVPTALLARADEVIE